MRSVGSSSPPGFHAGIGDDRQRHEAHEQQHDVQHDLAARLHVARGPVGVGVAEEQQELEEHEAGRPHGRGAAEPRQDLLRHERLDEEEQERAREYGQRVEDHRQAGVFEDGALYRRPPYAAEVRAVERAARRIEHEELDAVADVFIVFEVRDELRDAAGVEIFVARLVSYDPACVLEAGTRKDAKEKQRTQRNTNPR